MLANSAELSQSILAVRICWRNKPFPGGRELRADVSGGQRLTLIQKQGKVRLAFNDVTLIPAPS